MRRAYLFPRVAALFLSMNLALPSPALGLRKIQTKDSGLEEQELTAALLGSSSASAVGLEERHVDRVRRLVREHLKSQIKEHGGSSLYIGFEDAPLQDHLVKGAGGDWWIHLHLYFKEFPFFRLPTDYAGNGLLFRIVHLDRNLKRMALSDSLIEPLGTSAFVPLGGLVDEGLSRKIMAKARGAVAKKAKGLGQAMQTQEMTYVLGRAVTPGAEGLWAMVDPKWWEFWNADIGRIGSNDIAYQRMDRALDPATGRPADSLRAGLEEGRGWINGSVSRAGEISDPSNQVPGLPRSTFQPPGNQTKSLPSRLLLSSWTEPKGQAKYGAVQKPTDHAHVRSEWLLSNERPNNQPSQDDGTRVGQEAHQRPSLSVGDFYLPLVYQDSTAPSTGPSAESLRLSLREPEGRIEGAGLEERLKRVKGLEVLNGWRAQEWRPKDLVRLMGELEKWEERATSRLGQPIRFDEVRLDAELGQRDRFRVELERDRRILVIGLAGAPGEARRFLREAAPMILRALGGLIVFGLEGRFPSKEKQLAAIVEGFPGHPFLEGPRLSMALLNPSRSVKRLVQGAGIPAAAMISEVAINGVAFRLAQGSKDASKMRLSFLSFLQKRRRETEAGFRLDGIPTFRRLIKDLNASTDRQQRAQLQVLLQEGLTRLLDSLAALAADEAVYRGLNRTRYKPTARQTAALARRIRDLCGQIGHALRASGTDPNLAVPNWISYRFVVNQYERLFRDLGFRPDIGSAAPLGEDSSPSPSTGLEEGSTYYRDLLQRPGNGIRYAGRPNLLTGTERKLPTYIFCTEDDLLRIETATSGPDLRILGKGGVDGLKIKEEPVPYYTPTRQFTILWGSLVSDEAVRRWDWTMDTQDGFILQDLSYNQAERTLSLVLHPEAILDPGTQGRFTDDPSVIHVPSRSYGGASLWPDLLTVQVRRGIGPYDTLSMGLGTASSAPVHSDMAQLLELILPRPGQEWSERDHLVLQAMRGSPMLAVLFDPELLEDPAIPVGFSEPRQEGILIRLLGLTKRLLKRYRYPEEEGRSFQLGLLSEKSLLEKEGYRIIQILRRPESEGGQKESLRLPWERLEEVVINALFSGEQTFLVDVGHYTATGLEQVTLPDRSA